MPSERDIDNYINEIEEKNQIYMEEELEYAKKCHNLEESLGCPLEVVFKALKYGIWSVRYNTYRPSEIHRLIFMNDSYYLVVEDSYYNLKDYKKTWWLSKTKEE